MVHLKKLGISLSLGKKRLKSTTSNLAHDAFGSKRPKNQGKPRSIVPFFGSATKNSFPIKQG